MNGEEARDFGIVNDCVTAGKAEERAIEVLNSFAQAFNFYLKIIFV